MSIDPITGIDNNIGSENNITKKQSVSDFLTNVNLLHAKINRKNMSKEGFFVYEMSRSI